MVLWVGTFKKSLDAKFAAYLIFTSDSNLFLRKLIFRTFPSLDVPKYK